MIPNSPPGTTRRIGKSQGYLGLSVADCLSPDGVPMMLTSWQPSPKELAALVAGAPVYLWIIGQAHPPVMVEVGPEPVL